MNRFKILVTVPFTDAQKARLTEQLPDADYSFVPGRDVTAEQLRSADIIMGNVRPASLKEAAALKWIQLNSSGSDAYAAKGVLREDVILTNATGAYGLTVSEHMLAVTLFLMKKLGPYYRNQMEGRWRDEGKVKAIEGSRTLVIGLGDIGGRYARKMAALGSRVTGIRRTRAACPDYLEAIGVMEDLDRLLPEMDIVAMVLPNSPATRGLMNADRLSRMKPGSFLINVGRGSAVDQDALYHALQDGPLAAASIDVTDPEPLPEGHPLWTCRNLFITPHIAGEYHLDETLDQIAELFIDNLGRYARGETLRNPVDRSTGYRVSQTQPE